MLLVLLFDGLYFKGIAGDEGSNALAGLRFFIPDVSRNGLLHLPQAHRAVSAWLRLSPGRQHLPFPLVCLLAVCGCLIQNNLRWEAFFLYLGFRAYLRPGENIGLKVKNIVQHAQAPSANPSYSSWSINLHAVEDGLPGKTGVFDDSITLDTDPWMYPWLSVLTAACRPDAPRWPFDIVHIARFFKDATENLGMSGLEPSLYSLLHGGASEDILTGRRTPEGVMRRGRWRSHTSLRRYAKEAKLMAEVNKVPATVITYGESIRPRIGDVFDLAFHPTPPRPAAEISSTKLEPRLRPAPKPRAKRKPPSPSSASSKRRRRQMDRCLLACAGVSMLSCRAARVAAVNSFWNYMPAKRLCLITFDASVSRVCLSKSSKGPNSTCSAHACRNSFEAGFHQAVC